MKRPLMSTSLVFLAGLLSFGPLLEAQEHLDRYERGFRAMRYGLYNEAAWWFSFAGKNRPTPGGKPARLHGRTFTPYLPCYFEGVALFNAAHHRKAEQRWVECVRRYERLGTATSDYEAMIETYERFIAARTTLVADVTTLYREAVQTSRSDIEQLATETFDLILAIEEKSRFSGEPRYQSRLASLVGRLEMLQDRLRRRSQLSQARTIGPGTRSRSLRFASLGGGSQRTAGGTAPTSRHHEPEPYEGNYALLIAPPSYESPELKAAERLQASLDRLQSSLQRNPQGSAQQFQVLQMPVPQRRVLTKSQLLGLLSSKKRGLLGWGGASLLGRWTDPGERNLVFIVFTGHACKIGRVAIAPLFDSPGCEEARRDERRLKELAETGIVLEDIIGLTAPQRGFEGDLVVVLNTCHAELLAPSPSQCTSLEIRDVIDSHKPSVTFVAGSLKEETVVSLRLLDTLSSALDDCLVPASPTRPLTGAQLLRWIATRLTLSDEQQFIRLYKCYFSEPGDFSLRVPTRCNR